MAAVNDFTVWDNMVPVTAPGGDSEFSIWDMLVPLVDVDESTPSLIRRRVFEF